MALNIDENGTIYIYQGDSGDIVVSGLSTDKDYQVYFSVKNSKRETIGSELMVNSNYRSSVTFSLTSDFTNLFVVPEDEEFMVYNYGLKMCFDDTIEDTLLVANAEYGQLNNIIVFPKRVEGYNV